MATHTSKHVQAIANARTAYPRKRVFALGDTALYCLGFLQDISVKYPCLGLRMEEELAKDSIIVEPKGRIPFAIKNGANWYFCLGDYELDLDAEPERVYNMYEFDYCPLFAASLKRWKREEDFKALCSYYPKGTIEQLYRGVQDFYACKYFDHHYSYIDGSAWSWHNDRHKDLTQRSLKDPALAKMMADFKISPYRTW